MARDGRFPLCRKPVQLWVVLPGMKGPLWVICSPTRSFFVPFGSASSAVFLFRFVLVSMTFFSKPFQNFFFFWSVRKLFFLFQFNDTNPWRPRMILLWVLQKVAQVWCDCSCRLLVTRHSGCENQFDAVISDRLVFFWLESKILKSF